jgi:hypothetical protein
LSTDFSILFRFLDTLDRQVTGRQADHLPPEIEATLQQLLNGEAPGETERKALFQALRENPSWIAWLANQVKARRVQPSSDKS